jgi:hypothetical protein
MIRLARPPLSRHKKHNTLTLLELRGAVNELCIN